MHVQTNKNELIIREMTDETSLISSVSKSFESPFNHSKP